MNLYPLSYGYGAKVRGKMRRIDKRIVKEIFVDNKNIDSTLESLIILADGYRDDIAVGILSKHLDGKKLVGLVKSERTRISSIKNIPVYLSHLSKKQPLKNLVFIMDQENDTLEKIHSEIEKEINRVCNKQTKKVEKAERYFIYDCSLGRRKIKLVFIINGVDAIDTEKHSIEDHLLMAAEKLRISDINYLKTSKETWIKLEKESKSEKVYKKLLLDKKLAEEVFNQHFKGLKFIEY